jgi:S-adenosylmethionine synthetase
MTIESIAGKNPVAHTGRLYNLVARRIASAVADLAGVQDAECLVMSEIGRPIADPYLVDVRLGCERWDDHPLDAVTGIVRHTRERLDELRDELMQGQLSLY